MRYYPIHAEVLMRLNAEISGAEVTFATSAANNSRAICNWYTKSPKSVCSVCDFVLFSAYSMYYNLPLLENLSTNELKISIEFLFVPRTCTSYNVASSELHISTWHMLYLYVSCAIYIHKTLCCAHNIIEDTGDLGVTRLIAFALALHNSLTFSIKLK